MNTASMNNEAPTSFFSGHNEAPTDVKFKETKAEKPFVDATNSAAVKDLKMSADTFEGMSETTVNVVTFVSIFGAAYLVGMAVMYLVVMAALMIGGLFGSSILSIVLILAGYFALMFNATWMVENIAVPLGKVVITAYSWIHRKVKSLFSSKK